MTDYDVFNGDADGLCALLQLRSAEPRDAILITGVKRDIELLERVPAQQGDRVTVLDVSMDKNKTALLEVLAAGASVFYADHHFAGDIPRRRNLVALINTQPEVCTSMLVNDHLKGAFTGWAVVGAFGDNLLNSAAALAKPMGLSAAAIQQLKNLGTYINYNGYGSNLEDLHFEPAVLYQRMRPFTDPLAFIQEGKADFEKLQQGYLEDMSAARSLQPQRANTSSAVFILPNAAWARRVSGVYSNDLANASPARGHAVLTIKANGNYLVSVRAPLVNRTGADEFCMQFPSGGGRKAAAGINDLPAAMLDQFIDRFSTWYA